MVVEVNSPKRRLSACDSKCDLPRKRTRVGRLDGNVCNSPRRMLPLYEKQPVKAGDGLCQDLNGDMVVEVSTPKRRLSAGDSKFELPRKRTRVSRMEGNVRNSPRRMLLPNVKQPITTRTVGTSPLYIPRRSIAEVAGHLPMI